MLYAAIDIHKHAFQAAVLDPESGQVVEERFSADRESLARWAEPWRGRVVAVAIEATTGWRWVWRELVARGSIAPHFKLLFCAGASPDFGPFAGSFPVSPPNTPCSQQLLWCVHWCVKSQARLGG